MYIILYYCLQEIVSGVIDTSHGKSFLQAVWEHLGLILIPALKQSQKWGPVPKQRVNQFLFSMENYVEFLKSVCSIEETSKQDSQFAPCAGAQKSINDAVYLTLQAPVDLEGLSTSEGCITHARQPDTVAALEELVAQWCHQIEQVLVLQLTQHTVLKYSLSHVYRFWLRGVRCGKKPMTLGHWLS